MADVSMGEINQKCWTPAELLCWVPKASAGMEDKMQGLEYQMPTPKGKSCMGKRKFTIRFDFWSK
jgi:hypothetical protein